MNKIDYIHIKDKFFRYVPLWAVIGLIVFSSILHTLVSAHLPTQNGDNIEHIHSSFMIAIGQVPYKDFFQHHNPLLWYLFAPLTKIFEYNATISEVVCVISFLVFLKSLVYVYRINEEFLTNKLWGIIAAGAIITPSFKLYAIDFRPDNYMLFCLVAGIYYYFRYLRDKKLKDLSIAFIWFFVSFMFAQKAIFPLFILGLSVIWFWYKKEINTLDLLKASVYPIVGFGLFFFYLYHYDMLELYYVSNYTFNLNLVEGFDISRIVSFPKYMKVIVILGGIGALCSAFSHNKYWIVFGVMFWIEFLQRRMYFSPYSYYYWMLFYFAVFSAIPFLYELDKKNRVIRVLFIGIMYYFLFKVTVFYIDLYKNKREMYLPDYITQNINRCDYVFNGNGMMYNIFAKDPAYYWQLIGQLDVIGEQTGIYPKPNINRLILDLRPKFIYGQSYLNKFSDESGRNEIVHYVDKEIVDKYYNATGFGYVYEIKPEYAKKVCVRNEKTGVWSYID
ncbi:MAG: glycosyltransferase family 39 protein [Alphaproteobacteria bacterium]|nr:glycosyltransferase family 39 protein [Alphaproteobacteria bacterium]